MNKFGLLLTKSGKEIRGARAAILTDDAKFAQEEIVRNLETKKRALNQKLNAATDLYPDSELSLMVTRKDFDAASWTRNVQELKLELAELQVELDIAKETYKEWFDETVPAEKKVKGSKPAADTEKE